MRTKQLPTLVLTPAAVLNVTHPRRFKVGQFPEAGYDTARILG